MPPVTEAELLVMRLRYKAAYTAYQSSVFALNGAATSGVAPSKILIANEAKAHVELNDARAKLLAAMADR